jgi:hypothetical protein
MNNEAKLIAENNRLQSKLAKTGLELEKVKNELAKFKKEHDPVRKAFLELLDEAISYRERLGFDNSYFEYDYLCKANIV